MPKVLTQDQINEYDRDGFISPVTVMSPQEAGEFRKALEEAEAKWPEAFQGAGRNNAHLNFKFLDELVHDSRIVDAVDVKVRLYAAVVGLQSSDGGGVQRHDGWSDELDDA